jgi:nucleotide-binding universal stress UspA family protein
VNHSRSSFVLKSGKPYAALERFAVDSLVRKLPEPMSEQCRSIAVASTFSPRFEQVLAEAKRIRDRFDAQLGVIYVGEKSEDVTRKFAEAFDRLSLPRDSAIYFEQGDPAAGILKALRNNQIDLLIAGALEKELVLHPFLGNVARRLLREGRTSLVLFTSPQRQPEPLRNIVFVADYSEHSARALRQALHLASREGSERLFVIRIITTFDEARSGRVGKAEEEARLEHFVLDLGHTDVPMEVRCIRGNTGFAAADFVKSIGADLLVVPLDPTNKGGQFPPNLEWLMDVIPCNLWVIR